jgi:hypothetical protein
MLKSGWNSVRKNLSSQRSNASTDGGGSVALSESAAHAAAAAAAAAGKKVVPDVPTPALSEVQADDDDNPNNGAALELVVLLMDPVSRRFELLQLEFDSTRAKVSDLLTQIPLSVTESSLQQQQYSGVLDSTGSLQEGPVRLLEAFRYHTTSTSNKMVLVAKPRGVSSKECMRLAKPILTDTQVSIMVSGTVQKPKKIQTKSFVVVAHLIQTPRPPPSQSVTLPAGSQWI